ncbi:MAG: ATPase [Parcubacteria group bacterium Gr01-1014_30]|nr:MAG: ATPase [Parcubacteria group bacterium Gr01-1014_30]
MRFNFNYFSIFVLIKTFFAPWHKYKMSYGRRLDPWRYFEAFVFNSMSRAIGAFLRLFFIGLGILGELVLVFAGALFFICWLVLPALLALWFLFGFWLLSVNEIFALIVLLSAFGLAFLYAKGLFDFRIEKPRGNLAFEVARAIGKSKRNSCRLLYFLISDNPKMNFIFSRALLDKEEIKKKLKEHFKESESGDFNEIISEALKMAQAGGVVGIGDVLRVLARRNSVFQQILVQNDLRPQDIDNLVRWQEYLEEKISERRKFWEWKSLVKKGSLAKQWTAGYTITLDRYSTDITALLKKQGFPEVIGHRAEFESMERILSQRESRNSVLIVGEPGSGRRSIIRELAQKCALGQSLPELNYKRVVELNLPPLLAQTEAEETESLLDVIFREAVFAGNVILVIDNFHNFVSRAAGPGVADISGQLLPFLQLPQFQVVAITSFEHFHKVIEQNSQLFALFEKVDVSEISVEETFILLERLTLVLERKFKTFVSYPALGAIVKMADKYLPAIPFPEKATDLLESVVIRASQLKEKVVLPSDVANIVREKTHIPVGEIESKERGVLLNLEKLIHQRIVDQEEAVKEVSTALRRARSEVEARKGPMGSFLFLGPTGVGKTETAKALSEVYFGSEQRMIRLDMSEFQALLDIPRLLGGVGQEGLLTTPVRDNPFSLVLLDELEKAHPNILNLFLQVLDEGHITDGTGRKVDFKNSIVIATSNAGYQVILEALRRQIEWAQIKSKILDRLFAEGVFRPEFINRFDAVVVFKPLSKENLLDVAQLLLQGLKKNLIEKGIEFLVTEALKEKMAELGYSPVFGARQMRRVIQDKVENVLAQAILSGRLTRGSRAEINPETFELK